MRSRLARIVEIRVDRFQALVPIRRNFMHTRGPLTSLESGTGQAKVVVILDMETENEMYPDKWKIKASYV